MKNLRTSTLVGGVLAFCLAFAAIGYQADAWNKKTILTISETLAIPGATLTPGKYVVKLMDSSTNRHIVQVFNEDETQVIATILAIPNERLQPTGKSQFGFWEMPAGTPPALRSWFYPGDNIGQEFAYPKDVAESISASVKEEVPVLSDEDQARLANTPPASEQTRSEPLASKNEETDVQTAQAAPPAPTSEPSTAQPQPDPSPIATPTPAPERPAPEPERTVTERRTRMDESATLPATSSSLPLLGLCGAASLALGVVLRTRRRT